jgi:hypothetical protein
MVRAKNRAGSSGGGARKAKVGKCAVSSMDAKKQRAPTAFEARLYEVSQQAWNDPFFIATQPLVPGAQALGGLGMLLPNGR